MKDHQGQRAADIANVRVVHAADSDPAVSSLQALVAEWLGTTALLAVVVGSGIMGQQLSGGNGRLPLHSTRLCRR